jgi:hypothetical protein
LETIHDQQLLYHCRALFELMFIVLAPEQLMTEEGKDGSSASV